MKIMHPTLVASADSPSNRAATMPALESIAIDGAASRGEVCGTGTWAYAPSTVKPFTKSHAFAKNDAFTTMDHSQRKRLT